MGKQEVHASVREEFSKLDLDGKAAFLVEAIFSTAGSAVNEIGTRLNRLVALVSEPYNEHMADDKSTAGPDGAEQVGDEPETAGDSKKSSGKGKK